MGGGGYPSNLGDDFEMGRWVDTPLWTMLQPLPGVAHTSSRSKTNHH